MRLVLREWPLNFLPQHGTQERVAAVEEEEVDVMGYEMIIAEA